MTYENILSEKKLKDITGGIRPFAHRFKVFDESGIGGPDGPTASAFNDASIGNIDGRLSGPMHHHDETDIQII